MKIKVSAKIKEKKEKLHKIISRKKWYSVRRKVLQYVMHKNASFIHKQVDSKKKVIIIKKEENQKRKFPL